MIPLREEKRSGGRFVDLVVYSYWLMTNDWQGMGMKSSPVLDVDILCWPRRHTEDRASLFIISFSLWHELVLHSLAYTWRKILHRPYLISIDTRVPVIDETMSILKMNYLVYG